MNADNAASVKQCPECHGPVFPCSYEPYCCGECERRASEEHILSIETPFLVREVLASCSCGWESGWTANERYARAAWERHCQEDPAP
jgi:hypothetical protein